MAEKSPVEEVAEIISNNDQKVMELVKSCVYDIDTYFKDHASQYGEYGIYIDDEDSYEDDEELLWIGMNDILIEYGYVYEIDSSSYLEDYIYAVQSCDATKRRGLYIDSSWFDEDDDFETWLQVLDEKWEDKGFCIAGIDFDADDYILFPCPVNILEKLDSLAQKAGYRIDYAKNL